MTNNPGTELVPFENGDYDLRTLLIDGEPYVLVLDVCRELGYSNPSDALATHVDPADVQYRTLAVREGSREVSRQRPLVNEAGFYDLVLGSEAPGAKAFKRWVTHEVLPTLRKTGTYSTTDKAIVTTREKSEALAILQYQARIQRKEARELEAKGMYRNPVTGEIAALPSWTGDIEVSPALAAQLTAASEAGRFRAMRAARKEDDSPYR